MVELGKVRLGKVWSDKLCRGEVGYGQVRFPMPEIIAFQCQLWRISQDHEGQSKVTFAVPLSDLQHILQLGEWTQRLLTVTVRVDA